MPPVVFVVPGRLDTRTGGSIYDHRMVEQLRHRGWAVDVRELDGSFPYPVPAALDEASRVLGALPAGTTVVIDSLALGAMPDIVSREASRLRIVALVHLPLAADVSLDRETALRFDQAERRALGAATLVIVTGTATRSMLARYGVTSERVLVIEPGTDRAPVARGSGGPSVNLLCVATLNPGKGHRTLLTALAAVPERRWHLVCAGSLTRHPDTAAGVRARVAALGLDDHVSFAGDLEGPALAAAYDGADLFVLATVQETYGMAVAEALARGLPVVGTSTGAIPELVGEDAGLVVPVGDSAALAAALSLAIGDSACRARFAAGARRARNRLPTWEQASAKMADALTRLGRTTPR